MPLNFRNATEVTAGDSGYNNSDAIIPYTNGEGANEITFRRPPEYLRERSEVIRKAFDELEAVVSSDRGLMLLADPLVYVTWNGATGTGGDGKFSITADKALRFTPMISASNYLAEQDIWNRLTYVFDTDKQFTIRSRLRVCEGGSNIQVKFFFASGQQFGTGGTGVQLTFEGSLNDSGNYDPLFGPVLIKVQLSHDGAAIVSTWQDVIDGITGEAVYANVWVEPSVTTGETAVLAIAIDRQYLWEGIGLRIAGNQVAGCDSQGYSIAAIDFVTFFGEAEHCLDEGDALVLDFGSAQQRLSTSTIDSVVGILRRLHRSENTEPPVPRSMSGQVNRMNAVPICKVIGGYLYFVSGIVIGKGATGSLAPDNTLAGRLIDDTVPDAGETFVGAAVKNTPTTPFPGDTTLPIGTVGSQLQRIYESLQKTNEMRLLTTVGADQFTKLRIKGRSGETAANKQIEVKTSANASMFSVDLDGNVINAGSLAIGTGLYVGSAAGTPTDNDIYAEGDIAVGVNAIIANGLRVGFTGAPTADRIELGDADMFLQWAADVCEFDFAPGASFSYSRTNFRYSWLINTTEELRLTAAGLSVGNGLYVGAVGLSASDNEIYAEGNVKAMGGNVYLGTDDYFSWTGANWDTIINGVTRQRMTSADVWSYFPDGGSTPVEVRIREGGNSVTAVPKVHIIGNAHGGYLGLTEEVDYGYPCPHLRLSGGDAFGGTDPNQTEDSLIEFWGVHNTTTLTQMRGFIGYKEDIGLAFAGMDAIAVGAGSAMRFCTMTQYTGSCADYRWYGGDNYGSGSSYGHMFLFGQISGGYAPTTLALGSTGGTNCQSFLKLIGRGAVTSNPITDANYGWVFTKTSGGVAEVFTMDGAGNVNAISPHDENGTWIFDSKNVKTGIRKRVDMERLVSLVELLTGETLMVVTEEGPEC